MNVNTATLELRTVKLTKGLLQQIPMVHRLPEGTYDKDGNILPEKVVGWIHGSVLGDKHATAILFNLGGGEYRVFMYPGTRQKCLRDIKQIYIV